MSSGIRFPQPLKQGDRIAITAPSSGVDPRLHNRLDIVIGHLRSQGFEVVEGNCLRNNFKEVSAPKQERASEFMKFWKDPHIRAIMPPWGGELLVEILPLLDFEEIRTAPAKWLSGFSDISTLQFAMMMKSRVATLHGSNLMDLAPSQSDPLTTGLIKVMQLGPGAQWTQYPSRLHQVRWIDFATEPELPLNLTEPTQWKLLRGSSARLQGRMVGGCIDTIARLVGTPYGDLPRFCASVSDGIILFLEDCELAPCELARTLWNLRLAGWFESINGLLLGRSNAQDTTDPSRLSYMEAVESVVGDLPVPVIYDADLGHRPPQLSIVNGAIGELNFEDGVASLSQTLS